MRTTQVTNRSPNQIIQEIIIPQLTKEINEGQHFAQLRQVYNSLILATWYKKKLKNSILNQVYSDKNKIKGTEYVSSVIASNSLSSRNVSVGGLGHSNVSHRLIRFRRKLDARQRHSGMTDVNDVEAIYQQYLQSFKKGVYNFIKEEQDPVTKQIIPRKYFSGGGRISWGEGSCDVGDE